MRPALALIALAATAAPAPAQRIPTRVTGRTLAAICAENKAACLTYVMATIDTTQNAAANAGTRVNYCIPGILRNDQIADTVLDYLRAHNELANENAAAIVLLALRDSFRCP